MWLLWLHTACLPWLANKAEGPSERWECFALHYSDKDLKIEKAFVTLKLAKHWTLMSKTTDRTDPGLSLQEACRHFCSFLRWHEESVKWQASGGFGRLMWVITGSIPLSRDVTLQHRVVQFHLCIHAWFAGQTCLFCEDRQAELHTWRQWPRSNTWGHENDCTQKYFLHQLCLMYENSPNYTFILQRHWLPLLLPGD